MNQEKVLAALSLLGTVQTDKVTGTQGTVTDVIFSAFGEISVNMTAKVGDDGCAVKDWYNIKQVEPTQDVARVLEVQSFD